jgi:preprotein translocase subunit SecF
MNPISKKKSFFSDSVVIKNARNFVFSSSLGFVLIFFLFFSLTFTHSVDASVSGKYNFQTPAKTKVKPAKKAAKKVVKKSPKKAVVRKDTTQDIDPTNISSPLFQKNDLPK